MTTRSRNANNNKNWADKIVSLTMRKAPWTTHKHLTQIHSYAYTHTHTHALSHTRTLTHSHARHDSTVNWILSTCSLHRQLAPKLTWTSHSTNSFGSLHPVPLPPHYPCATLLLLHFVALRHRRLSSQGAEIDCHFDLAHSVLLPQRWTNSGTHANTRTHIHMHLPESGHKVR